MFGTIQHATKLHPCFQLALSYTNIHSQRHDEEQT